MREFEGTKDEILKKAREKLSPEIVKFIDKVNSEEFSKSNLIEVLHMVQREYGYLERTSLQAVAYLMNIPAAKITGVASFYHYFNLKKMGKYHVEVCLGTACHVKGADKIAKKLKDELGIDFGETTKDGLFSLAMARCIGMCALAPVITVNGKVHQNVAPKDIPKILEEYVKSS